MFHKIKNAYAIANFCLCIQFSEGITKIYDVKPLFKKWPVFKSLKENENLFKEIQTDKGGYGVYWNDEIDLSCDELFYNGKTITIPFDNLMAFSDATELWGLNESTLRKAIAYGKLVSGIDVCKFGKQWLITKDAMYRKYGNPKEQ